MTPKDELEKERLAKRQAENKRRHEEQNEAREKALQDQNALFAQHMRYRKENKTGPIEPPVLVRFEPFPPEPEPEREISNTLEQSLRAEAQVRGKTVEELLTLHMADDITKRVMQKINSEPKVNPKDISEMCDAMLRRAQKKADESLLGDMFK